MTSINSTLHYKRSKLNKLLITFSILILTSCSTLNKKDNIMQKENKSNHEEPLNNHIIPKVTGIGGIFFYSDDPNKSNEWYSKNLGIKINDWGSSSFESRNVNRPDEINSLQWKPFKKGEEYFSPSQKGFMINYQVQNIEELVNKLKDNGVTILDSIVTYDYGKFIHIMDNEGNKIQLWEPN
jgi:predicted enzyme related to lactoylglutathione lyase